jgi:hypothetical protein
VGRTASTSNRRSIEHHQQALRQARRRGRQRDAIVLRKRLPDDLDERPQHLRARQLDAHDRVAAPVGGLVSCGEAFVVGKGHRVGVPRV